jgi:hypothetical protein
MKVHEQDFPFDEIKKESGDYFNTIQEAMNAGYIPNQIWSVVEGDDEKVFIYGPCHHVVNLIGYIATKEYHDGETYYQEEF